MRTMKRFVANIALRRTATRYANRRPERFSLAPKARWTGLLLAAWSASILTGAIVLAIHETAPGPAAANAQAWQSPAASSVSTLLVFLHPKCPCSVATAGELARLIARCGDRLKVEVFIFQPTQEPKSWSETSVAQSVRSIPGVAVSMDPDAKLARQLGVKTSGQVLLYDKSGHMLFAGGITASRGHEGDNDGADAIAAIVLDERSQAAQIHQTPVFGCPLYACSAGGQPK